MDRSPATAAEALAAVRSGLEFLASADAAGLTLAEQADCIRGLAGCEPVQLAASARVLSAFCAGGGPAADGQGSVRSWLRWQIGMTSAAAGATVKWVHERARQGLLDPARWHADHQHLSVPEALQMLASIQPADELVVCHGDSCAPNTLLTDDGCWSGHVDLGDLGVADRWADLAVVTWSTTWNFGPGWEIPLLDAYGVQPDPERTRYYLLLWDLSP